MKNFLLMLDTFSKLMKNFVERINYHSQEGMKDTQIIKIK